jgi:hypothetical protein
MNTNTTVSQRDIDQYASNFQIRRAVALIESDVKVELERLALLRRLCKGVFLVPANKRDDSTIRFLALRMLYVGDPDSASDLSALFVDIQRQNEVAEAIRERIIIQSGVTCPIT